MFGNHGNCGIFKSGVHNVDYPYFHITTIFDIGKDIIE